MLNKSLIYKLFLVICFLFAAAQTSIGQVNVFLISGDWQSNGKKLSKGAQLQEGDTIRNVSRNKNDHIVIKWQGITLSSVFCNNTDCSKTLVIKKNKASSDSFVSRTWNSVMSYWSAEPEYTVNLARGGLTDGIVFVYKGVANFTEYFQNLEKKNYRLNFVNHSSPKDVVKAEVDTTFKPKTVEIENLKTGIYELTNLRTPSEPVWILVVPIENYCESKTQFAQFKEETVLWDKQEGINAETILRFNRMFLLHLEKSFLSAE